MISDRENKHHDDSFDAGILLDAIFELGAGLNLLAAELFWVCTDGVLGFFVIHTTFRFVAAFALWALFRGFLY
jgi:hypothetical protein